MKFKTTALFDEIRGTLGKKWVAGSVKNILEHRGEKVDGVIRRKVNAIVNTFENDNVKQMFSLTATFWGTLSEEEKKSWDDEAKSLIESDYVVKSGFQLFMAYILSLYVQTYSLYCLPVSVTATTKTYDGRGTLKIACQEI